MIKKLFRTLITLTVSLVFASNAYTSEVPKGIAGITLGSKASSYHTEKDSPYLIEKAVETNSPFRKATLSYGQCQRKGQILKIKVKYLNKSKKFFDELNDKITAKYGEGKWQGDSFGIVRSWKWEFKDAEGKKVNLVLDYNLKDTELSMGSVLKISYPVLIEEERLCSIKGQSKDDNTPTNTEILNWDDCLPQ
ncbi:MAG: hypothetical protein OCC45_12765 [Desulfotalea sp.]